MKFSVKDFFIKFDHADLVTFTKEILNGKLHFCAVRNIKTDFNFFFDFQALNMVSLTYLFPIAPFLYPLKTSENLMVLERVLWEQMG